MNTLEICNMALSMLGINLITSLNDENTQARQCANFFPQLRDRLLREHSWSFALRTHKLVAKNEEPIDDWAYVCALPVNFLSLVKTEHDEPYLIVGNNILINELCSIIFVSRIEDSEEFDPLFTEALQYKLAGEIAMANTCDMQTVNYYQTRADELLAKAKAKDSQENEGFYQTERKRSTFLEARRR